MLHSKTYELSNHLGNVLTVISDRKIAVALASAPTVVGHYLPDVISASDYYAFGAPMPGRQYSSSTGYRYGFNGKENDNEVKGMGNQQDYGMRIYDPRLGRFLSVDPLFKDFAWNSVYSFAEGNPIEFIDLDGLERAKNTALRRTSPILNNKHFAGGGLAELFGGIRGKYLKNVDFGKGKVNTDQIEKKKTTSHTEETEKTISNPLDIDKFTSEDGEKGLIPKYKNGTLNAEIIVPTSPEGTTKPVVTYEYGVKDSEGNVVSSKSVSTSENTKVKMDFNLKEGEHLYMKTGGCVGCSESGSKGSTAVTAETKVITKTKVKDE